MAVPEDRRIAVTPLTRHRPSIVVPDHVQMEPVVKVGFSQCLCDDKPEACIDPLVLSPGRKIGADRQGESRRRVRFVLEVVEYFETEIAAVRLVSRSKQKGCCDFGLPISREAIEEPWVKDKAFLGSVDSFIAKQRLEFRLQVVRCIRVFDFGGQSFFKIPVVGSKCPGHLQTGDHQ